VRNDHGPRGSGPPQCRNPTRERPIRAQTSACATTAYSPACSKRAFEVPILQPYRRNAGLFPLFKIIYEDTQTRWGAYAVAEQLVDVEEFFQLWRFRHMKTVERIIGYRPGTGGSSGVGFLKKALELTFFPELREVRTVLGTAG